MMACRTGYERERDMVIVMDPAKIAKRYSRGWFIIDLLSVLPLELGVYLARGEASRSKGFPHF
jgi:hypothetical protein